jgi:hypothetical protein
MSRYPNITVPLSGEDGNAFSILGRVKRIMARNEISGLYDEYRSEATAGDYDHLLATTMRWFSVS